MKKIVGILAAAAIMATSVFAADVSVILNGYGDLFSMSFEDGAKPNVLGWNDPWDRQYSWSSTGLGFAFYGDKAGFSFELDGNNNANNTNRLINVKNSKAWVQPLDMLKIALGSSEIALPKEQIDWDGTVFVTDYEGWTFTLTPVAGLSVDLGLVTKQPTGWSTNYWYGEKNYDGATTMGEIAALVTYGADFGTIKAVYDYNKKTNVMGLDYAGTFGSVNVSPAVSYTMADKVSKLAADLYVTTGIDALGIAAYTKADIDLNDTDALAVQVKAKFTYGTGFGSAYLYVNDANVLADSFAMTVKPGVTFNVGSCAFDVAAQLDVAATTKISVPFSYKMSF